VISFRKDMLDFTDSRKISQITLLCDLCGLYLRALCG